MVLHKAKSHAKKAVIPGAPSSLGSSVIKLDKGQIVDFSFLPDKKADTKIIKLINSAKKTLDIAMYTWTHEPIAKAVIKKQEEGVQVTAIIDGGQGGEQGTGQKVTTMLEKAGVKVILPKANRFKLMHHKFARIDKETIIHGSTNWTQAAFEKNMDCFAVFTQLTESDKKSFDAIWEDLLLAAEKKKPQSSKAPSMG